MTLFYNANVYTGEKFAEAFAVEDGKFTFVGSNEEANKLNCSERINLQGKFVCSGFNDSHMHLLNYGQALACADLSANTSSLSGMLDYLRGFNSQGEFSEDNWLVGRGWNQDYFEDTDKMPTRKDLDSVSKDVPILISRACGHCIVVNSKAIELAKVDKNTPQVDGGEICYDEFGELDGRFFDNAMDYIYSVFPVPNKEQIKEMLKKASKALNSYGTTSCQSDDYCVFAIPFEIVNEAYKELIEEGELTVRVYEQSNFTSLDSLKKFVESGLKTNVGDDMFKIGPLKMLGDGALGARTAYLSVPYADDNSTQGFPCFDQKTMDEMISYANKNDMQVAVHSIGDKCLDMLLSAYEKALNEHPRENHRHGVVHCQITRPDQLKKIEELKLHVYAQSIFLDYDIHIVKDRVGEELAKTSYSWKTLMNNGVSVSNGSDCPVEWPDCLKSMECAVTRCTVKDNLGPYLPSEAFTVKEAIDSYTTQSAYAQFAENYKGKIKENFLADFVVLDESPFEVQPKHIHEIKVNSTYLGGVKVFG